MNVLQNRVLLDRALITTLVLDAHKKGYSHLQVVIEAIGRYKQVLYEPSGISALESRLQSINNLNKNLVAVSVDISIDVGLDENETQLFRRTIEVASKRLSIIQAIQTYEKAKRGPSRPYEEILGYIVRLLILARHFQADIAPWPARAALFLDLFQESGVGGYLTDLTSGIKIFKTELCRFPYLPQQKKPASANHFGILIFEPLPPFEDFEESIHVISILFLAADPTDASRLRLGEEAREIQQKLQLAKFRERFELHQRMSVRPADISQALLDVQPQIVHFSGHGMATGALCFENLVGETHPIEPDALAALFKQFAGQVNCVVLNACYSEIQANAIAKHVNHVIGMNQAIGDRAAIAFAVGFYQAVGAGRTIENAYQLGCVQIRLQGIPEHLTPVLIKKG